MKRTVLIEALVGGNFVLHTFNRPTWNLRRMRAPAKDRRYVFQFFVWSGETCEELLNIEKFGGKLHNIIVSSFKLLFEFFKEVTLAIVESIDEQRVKLSKRFESPDVSIG